MLLKKIILIVLVIFNSALFSQTTISLGKITKVPQNSVLVPFNISAPLTNVKSISVQFSYDVNNVSFNHEAKDIKSGIKNFAFPSNNNFFVADKDGIITLSWISSSTGVTLAGKFFDLDFKYMSGFSEIRIVSATIKDINGKKLPVTFQHGSISQNTNYAVKVIYPNGGESLEVFGSPANITWTSIYVQYVNLDYSTDNGTTWKSIAENYEAIKNNYEWTVPRDINSDVCKIRISEDVEGAIQVSDVSDDVFTINSAPVITLTTPNGTEELKVGGVKSIKWDFKNIADVSIEYSTNASSPSPVWQTIAASVPAINRSYEWIIPNSISADCKLRISDLTNSNVYDASDAIFKIHSNPINVTIANTVNAELKLIGILTQYIPLVLNGYLWWNDNDPEWHNVEAHYEESGVEYDAVDTLVVHGSVPVNIGWLTSVQYLEMWLKYDPEVLDLVSLIPAIPELNKMNYSDDNGEIHIIWGTNVPLDIHGKIFDLEFKYLKMDDPFEWLKINSWNPLVRPDPRSPTANIDPRNFSNIKIDKISVKNSHNNAIDVSSFTNGSLAISDKKAVKLLAPVSGEIVEVNDGTYKILWSSRTVTNISLNYSTNNGSSWNLIAGSIPASFGIYNWTLPNLNSECKIKIVSGDGTAADTTLPSFTLTNVKALNLLSPDGGEVLKTGTERNITWSCTNLSKVKLEYTTGDDAGWILIDDDVPAKAYSYKWIIPAVNSSTCKVKISEVAAPAAEDLSASVFTINNSKTKISISYIKVNNNTFNVPVSSEIITGATYFYLSIRFDPSVMNFVKAIVKPVIENKGQFNFLNDNGTIRVIWFSTTPVDLSGVLFVLRFSNYNGTASSIEFDTPNHVKDSFNKILDIDFVNGGVATKVSDDLFLSKKDTNNSESIPDKYAIWQNFPNPFNPVTTIRYAVPEPAHVSVCIYNLLGEKILTLADELKEPGFYTAVWNADNYSSGIYYYSFVTDKFTEIKKMILLK